MDCLKVCYSQALEVSGGWYTVDELMRLFNRDRCYWGPEGGVTFSGGEPLLQKDFIFPLLERCHDACISMCVETNAYIARPVLQSVLPLVEWLFIDIKHMNSEKHAEGTGVPNDLILDNIRWISSTGWPGRMIIRTPIIPGYNDTAENAKATAHFLTEIGLKEINLLPFHRLGASKYVQLGITYE
jgi:pyruvate formate lyase activating enzyme